jgi:hypothetical protein
MLEAGLDVLLTEESLIPGRGLLVGERLREDDYLLKVLARAHLEWENT